MLPHCPISSLGTGQWPSCRKSEITDLVVLSGRLPGSQDWLNILVHIFPGNSGHRYVFQPCFSCLPGVYREITPHWYINRSKVQWPVSFQTHRAFCTARHNSWPNPVFPGGGSSLGCKNHHTFYCKKNKKNNIHRNHKKSIWQGAEFKTNFSSIFSCHCHFFFVFPPPGQILLFFFPPLLYHVYTAASTFAILNHSRRNLESKAHWCQVICLGSDTVSNDCINP